MTRSRIFALAASATIVASGIGLAPGALAAAGASDGSTSKSAALSSTDRQFVMEAAKGGMTEVELGQLAQQKGSSDSVKQFGARMVEDHGKANDELKELATKKGITLPAKAPKDATTKKLEGLSGSSFDRAYMATMLSDHKKDVAAFEKQARATGGDADVKAFASKTLPTLQSHLKMVEAERQVGAASGAAMKQ